jgi:hypothetical protein
VAKGIALPSSDSTIPEIVFWEYPKRIIKEKVNVKKTLVFIFIKN